MMTRHHSSDDFRVLNVQAQPRTDCSARVNIIMDIVLPNGQTRIQLKKVPKFLDNAFQKIIKHGMNTDGLFRKEGSSVRLSRPEVAKVYEGAIDIPSDFSVIDMCTMVKRFLREMQPPLIDSNSFKERLLRLAARVKLSGNYELDHTTIADLFYNSNPQLSDASMGTMAYVMRQFNIIASRSDSHKMTVDNLAVVLVGCVFNDAVNAHGITESIRKRQQKRPPLKHMETMLVNAKVDMQMPIEAVKILITNAKYIAIPQKYYISSWSTQTHGRSNSALPILRKTEEPSTSTEGRRHPYVPLSKGTTTRRESDSSSATTTSSTIKTVKNDRLEVVKKRRSSSFLPNFRDIKEKVFSRKNRSPSGNRFNNLMASTEKLAKEQQIANDKLAKKRASENDDDTLTDVFETPVRKDTESIKSCSSGRKSRSQASKINNPNSARHTGGKHSWSKSERSIISSDRTLDFDSSNAIDIKLLQSERSQRSTRSRRGRQEIKPDLFISPKLPPIKIKKPLTERCNMAPPTSTEQARGRPGRRRFTEPINTGVPFHRRKEISRRKTFAEKREEKENILGDLDVPDDNYACTSSVESINAHDESFAILERKCEYSRQRRVGLARHKGKPNTDSLIGLNGSIAHAEGERIVDAVQTQQVVTQPRCSLEGRGTKAANDYALGILPQNGQAWIGATQLVISSPQPAKKSVGSVDCTTPKRFSMSPSPRHLVQTNNSPASFMTTTTPMRSSPRTPRTPIHQKAQSIATMEPMMFKKPEIPIRSVTIIEQPKKKEVTMAIPEVVVDNFDNSSFKCPQMPAPAKNKARTKPAPPMQQTVSMSSFSRRTEDSMPPPLLFTDRSTSQIANDDSNMCFGDFTDLLRNSSESQMHLLTPNDMTEMRPSVALIRNQQSGLVRSRVNHFQEIAQLSVASDTFFSGRSSALSARMSDGGTESTLSSSARPSFGSVCSVKK